MPQDTVRVVGNSFGASQGESAVLFSSTVRDAEATIVSWSSGEIRALVPDTALDGPVRVRVDGVVTNGISFSVADSLISLVQDVEPLWLTFQCMACHSSINPGGTFRIASGNIGSLVLDYQAIFTTGTNPPNVVARQSSTSKMVQRLLPTAGPGLRMPQDQFPRYLNDAEIQVIADWIDQGARNN